MFKTKNNDKKNQLNYIKFLFDIQNKLIKFNWNLMENYKNTKKVDIVDSMNLIQDSINSLNKAQLNFSKVTRDENVVNINNKSTSQK
ncbi:MAG: hypothetical protein CMI85_02690 [Candidatus Pelagibacter sp.]|nr:hypothetical protein [Candidatus Pelagibacter sp.]